MRTTYTTHSWYKHHGAGIRPIPQYGKVKDMLAKLEEDLAASGSRPVELRCECWEVDRGDYLAVIKVTAEPGQPTRSLPSWFQWRHPRWLWSTTPLPFIEHEHQPQPIRLQPGGAP